ncbi:MAG: metal-sensitive transcriptional regulator [bacterium]
MGPSVHTAKLPDLRRIEGQVRGVQKMIEEKRYCVDILIQMVSIVNATIRVRNDIFRKHIEGCVTTALTGKSKAEKQQKIDEVLDLLSRFRGR